MTFGSFDPLDVVASSAQQRSQWDLGSICACDDHIMDAAPCITYYPIQRLFVYGSKSRGWHKIYGVTKADLKRVAEKGGGIKDLEKPEIQD